MTRAISKTLSRNDSGETGGHQAGILVPKRSSILDFFPELDRSTKNPRKEIYFVDHLGEVWRLVFIYYNNSFFGGTRNEYRLTWLTRYFNRYGMRTGDKLTLYRDDLDRYRIKHEYADREVATSLVLGTSWEPVNVKFL